MKLSEIFSRSTVRESSSTSWTPAPRLVPSSKSFKCHSCSKIQDDSEFSNPDTKICKSCENFTGSTVTPKDLTSKPSLLPPTNSEDGRSIENIYVPSHKECDCIDHFVNDSEGLKKALEGGGREGREEFHRNVSKTWRSMMNEPDDDKRAANVAFLTTLKRTHPSNEKDEFANHYLMHLYGGGQSWVDHGIRDEELGDNFKNSQRMMQSAELGAKNPTYHNLDNCGACNQYLTALKGHASKFHDRLEKNILFRPGKAKAGAAATLKGMFEGWAKGEPLRSDSDSSLRAAHGVLNEWKNHVAKSHKYSFNNFFQNYAKVNSPSKEDRKSGNPQIVDMFYRMRDRLPSGWSRNKNDIPEGAELPVRDKFNEPTIDEDTPHTLVNLVLEQSIKDKLINKKTRSRGPSTNIVPSKEKYEYIDEHGTPMRSEKDVQIIKQIPAPSEVTIEYGDQALTGFPGQGQFTRTITKPYQQTYNRADDPRFKKDFYDEPFALNEEHPEIVEKKYKNLPIPRQHKFLFERAGMMPNVQPWVDYHAGKGDQTVGQKAQARLDYHRSFDEALGKAYPGLERQEAVNNLESEHSSAVSDAERMQSESLKAKNRYLQASKESNTMEHKKFNSKEAHFDPSAIVHGIGHAWDYLTNSMQHPFNEMIKGHEDDVAKGAKWLTRWKAENPAPSPSITTQMGQTVYNEALQHAEDHANNFGANFHGLGETATGLAGDAALGYGVVKGVGKAIDTAKNLLKKDKSQCYMCGNIGPSSEMKPATHIDSGQRVEVCSHHKIL